jgi:hypothetical protein
MVIFFSLLLVFLMVANYNMMLALMSMMKSVEDIDRNALSVWNNTSPDNDYKLAVFYTAAIGWGYTSGIATVIDLILLCSLGLPPMALTLVFIGSAVCVPHLVIAAHRQIDRIQTTVAEHRKDVALLRERYGRGEPAVTEESQKSLLRSVSILLTGRFKWNNRTKTYESPKRKLIRGCCSEHSSSG